MDYTLYRSYYCKWSAALQYFTRLARCTIECESIVLALYYIILYTKNYNKGFDYC